MHKPDGKAGGGIKHGVFDAHVIDELDHVFRFRLRNLIRAAGAEAARPAIERREERIGAGAAHAAVFAFEVFFDLFVILVNMSVGIDDFGILHESHPLLFSCFNIGRTVGREFFCVKYHHIEQRVG